MKYRYNFSSTAIKLLLDPKLLWSLNPKPQIPSKDSWFKPESRMMTVSSEHSRQWMMTRNMSAATIFLKPPSPTATPVIRPRWEWGGWRHQTSPEMWRSWPPSWRTTAPSGWRFPPVTSRWLNLTRPQNHPQNQNQNPRLNPQRSRRLVNHPPALYRNLESTLAATPPSPVLVFPQTV